jgi:hypothetical protein
MSFYLILKLSFMNLKWLERGFKRIFMSSITHKVQIQYWNV